MMTSMSTTIAASLLGYKKNLELQVWGFMVKVGETEQMNPLNFSTLFLQGKHVFFNLSGFLIFF